MKIGDRVKIVYSRNYMCPEMEAYCGQYATIVDLFVDSSNYTYYLLDIDNQEYTWTEQTLKLSNMKVGDKVKIKSLDWYNANKEEYYGYSAVKCGKDNFVFDMTNFCGKEATITRINAAGFIFLDIDRGNYRWTEEMFETINTSEGFFDIPEGYVFDRVENNKIYLKKTEPKTWEECIQSWNIFPCQYIDNSSRICDAVPLNEKDRNCVPRGLGEPMLALMQLLVCREVYRQGWKPDFTQDSPKYTITNNKNQVVTNESRYVNKILSFQTSKVRDEFLKNFKDLIEVAKELI